MPYLAHTGKKLSKAYRKKKHYMRLGQHKVLKIFEKNTILQLSDGKSKSFKMLKIVKSPANRSYMSRGIVVKGSHVKTKMGIVEITSKPQSGTIYSKLVQ